MAQWCLPFYRLKMYNSLKWLLTDGMPHILVCSALDQNTWIQVQMASLCQRTDCSQLLFHAFLSLCPLIWSRTKAKERVRRRCPVAAPGYGMRRPFDGVILIAPSGLSSSGETGKAVCSSAVIKAATGLPWPHTATATKPFQGAGKARPLKDSTSTLADSSLECSVSTENNTGWCPTSAREGES